MPNHESERAKDLARLHTASAVGPQYAKMSVQISISRHVGPLWCSGSEILRGSQSPSQ
jgi:hypothetical protein